MAWLRLGGKGRSQAVVLAGVTNFITTVNIFFFRLLKLNFAAQGPQVFIYLFFHPVQLYYDGSVMEKIKY